MKGRNEFPKPDKISLQLAILRSGEIRYVQIRSGGIDKTEVLIKALKEFSNQWVPGKQNGHIICCYRNMDIDFLEDKIQIHIPPRL